jgi:ATP-binding cassette subfamily C protein LapB
MSASILALADLPFGLLMIAVIFFIGGPVGWILVITASAAIAIGLLNQVPLRQAVKNSTTSNVERQAFISETINGLESVKGCHAEGKLQHRLESMMHEASANEVRSHWLSILGTSTTSFLIHLTTIAVVVVSVFRIQAGEMSMGGMIACVMLGARSLAPLAMVAGLMTRLQQSLEALRGLNEVMSQPRETDAERQFVKRDRFQVHYRLQDVALSYPGQVNPALQELNLEIEPGERIGILGRIGSGKSSLLRLLAKLYEPNSGTILLDGIELRQYHPAALRRVVGYLPQNPTLFNGSIRDNILLGAQAVGDEAVLAAARMAGLEGMINQQVDGVHHQVGERGRLLSGGQRQAVALARALVTQPRCLLLDEPTASMDPQSERNIIQALKRYLDHSAERSLILTSHKQSMLELVDRLVVIDSSRVVADGKKEEVLKELRERRESTAPEEEQRAAMPGVKARASR